MKLTTTVTAALAIFSNIAIAQNVSRTDQNIQNYIDKYKDIAIQEQIRTGIPAAIKLAQGIHETSFGQSELCQNANNHFGIKCKSNWTGPSYAYTDDAKDECFRMYNSDLESYKDHSNFLISNKRYAKLFTYEVTDYKSWANGLKQCGYATNPKYAVLIISLIEKFQLNEYTLIASNSAMINSNNNIAAVQTTNKPAVTTYSYKTSPTTTTSNTPVVTTTAAPKVEQNDYTTRTTQQQNLDINVPFYVTTTLNGLSGFYAKKGDMLLEYATKNNIRYTKLIAMNQIPDAPLEADMFIYLEKKMKKGLQEKYTVKEGETLIQISQKTGVDLNQIKLLNKLVEKVEVKAGEIINLQHERTTSPEVYIPSSKNVTRSNNSNTPSTKTDDYIVNNKKVETPIEEQTTEYTFGKSNNNNTSTPKPNASVTPKPESKPNNTNNSRGGIDVSNNSKKEEVVVVKEPAVIEKRVTETKPVTNNANYDNLSPYDKLKLHMEKNANKTEEFTGPSSGATTKNVAVTPQEVTTVNSTFQQEKPSNTSPKASNSTTTYKVKKGDALFSIANKFNVTIKQLEDWNKVTAKTLTVGKVLKVSK